MQPGEVVLTRLSGGISIGRCLDVGSSRVRISVGRNREVRVPPERVILATGVIAAGQERVEEFLKQCEDLASEIDLAEVWEVARDERAPIGLDDLAELHWGRSPGPAQRAAMLLHLEKTSLHFFRDDQGYVARSLEDLTEIQTRRQREAENARDASALAASLAADGVPPEMTGHQSALLEHLGGYAVHGDSYTRSAAARGLLELMGRSSRDLQRLAFDVLVKAGVFSPDEPLELERAGIPVEFPAPVLTEAVAVDPARALEEPGRRDLTAAPTLTIDDEGTRDRDDALSLELDEQSPGATGPTYRVAVHIADARALIPLGGLLDEEAALRMATLYLPERKVTMLPAEVCEQKGSLNPGETRAAISLVARFDESYELLDWEVVPSVIRSQVALSYEEADRAIEEEAHRWNSLVAPLNRIAVALRHKREARGALNLGRPEISIRATASGDVEVTVVSRTSPARLMVTELMILCNSLTAELCHREGIPAAYRSQVIPDLSDIPDDIPEGPLRWYLVMRRLAPADIGVQPAAHGGLGVSAYIQTTSPLRRYPDLVMQRQISHFLDSAQAPYTQEAIASVAQRADMQIREIGRLEEDRRRYWFLKYLKQRLTPPDGGDEPGLLSAVVLEQRPNRPALVELVHYPFRVRADLPAGCAPGDAVTLRVQGIDLWRRIGQFVYVHPTA